MGVNFYAWKRANPPPGAALGVRACMATSLVHSCGVGPRSGASRS